MYMSITCHQLWRVFSVCVSVCVCVCRARAPFARIAIIRFHGAVRDACLPAPVPVDVPVVAGPACEGASRRPELDGFKDALTRHVAAAFDTAAERSMSARRLRKLREERGEPRAKVEVLRETGGDPSEYQQFSEFPAMCRPHPRLAGPFGSRS